MLAVQSGRTVLQASVNGTPVPGLIRATISETNSYAADTWSLNFALGATQAQNAQFWSQLFSAYVELYELGISQYGSDSSTIITGMADTIWIDPQHGIVGVEGRDLTAALIDSYQQRTFVNQTAAEVVATIAQYHNLQPLIASTTSFIGRYYGDGYTRLSLGQFSKLQSDWDIVVELARQNSFDAFVLGNSLYFQPSDSLTQSVIELPISELINIRVETNLNLISSPPIQFQSWNSQAMAPYNESYISNGSTEGGQTSSVGTPFLFSGSNFTSQQVALSAQQYASEIGRLTTVLHAKMPWNTQFGPRQKIELSGTQSDYDGSYRIESVERSYSTNLGSCQSFRAARVSAS